MTRPKPAPAPKRTGDPRTDTEVPNPIEDDPSPSERAAKPQGAPKQPDVNEDEPGVERLNHAEGDLVRAMWYGDPGLGKTTSMLMAANLGPVVVWDAENRMKAGALRRAGVNVDNIHRLTDVSYPGMGATLDGMLEADDTPFAVCFDGVTEMCRVMVQHSVDDGVRRAARRGEERLEWRTFQEDYGDVLEQFRRLLRKALRLPCHFGMTAASIRGEDENKEIRISPQLTPAILRDVNSAMDIICCLRIDDVTDETLRSGLFIPGGRYEAKDTFGVMPRRLANPTFPRILGYVNEELDVESDPEQARARELLAKASAAEVAKAES